MRFFDLLYVFRIFFDCLFNFLLTFSFNRKKFVTSATEFSQHSKNKEYLSMPLCTDIYGTRPNPLSYTATVLSQMVGLSTSDKRNEGGHFCSILKKAGDQLAWVEFKWGRRKEVRRTLFIYCILLKICCCKPLNNKII